MSKIVMGWGYLGFVFLFLYFSHLSSSFSLAFSNVIYGPANASVSLHAYVQKANRGFFQPSQMCSHAVLQYRNGLSQDANDLCIC